MPTAPTHRRVAPPRGLWKYLDAFWRCVRDPTYRAYLALRWRKPRRLFQANNHTCADRYPELFRAVQTKLGDSSSLRILSFGCSTGEEVFSLRSYFPAAQLKGIDINPANIAICEQRLAEHPDTRMTFACTDSAADEPPSSYDAVFCLAVFRHGDLIDPRHTRCDTYIRFEVFSEVVSQIAERLKPGGLLIIQHANFRFCDTATAAGFRVAGRWNSQAADAPITPVFDEHNCRTNVVNYDEVIFEKLAPPIDAPV